MKDSEINKLGKELELYTTIDYIGKGFPIILPKGSKIIKTIRNYVEDTLERNNYKNVRTPSISNSQIYKIEDRYESEKDNLFLIKKEKKEDTSNLENEVLVLKPYVEPFHCSIFREKQYSYKNMPVKYFETSEVFRNERNIKGIIRTRQITLSDASVFCEYSKIKNELKNYLQIQSEILEKLKINEQMTYTISNWDYERKEEYIGRVDEWNNCFEAMKNALDELKIKYSVDKKAKMFGPSITLKYDENVFSTLQIDFEITHRFDLKYTNKENEPEVPIYFHAAAIGSYENLLSILIKRYKGAFPYYIAPIQIIIVNDGEEFDDYTEKINKRLIELNIRTEIDYGKENKEEKAIKAINLKVPYVIEIGKKELNTETITVDKIKETDSGNIKVEKKKYKIEDFIEEEINCQTKF